MEFIQSLGFDSIYVLVTIVILIFILGKFGMVLVKMVLMGFVFSMIAGAILYFIFNLPLEIVSMVSLVAFILGAVFGKVKLSD